jgi:hypothetical protein
VNLKNFSQRRSREDGDTLKVVSACVDILLGLQVEKTGHGEAKK